MEFHAPIFVDQSRILKGLPTELKFKLLCFFDADKPGIIEPQLEMEFLELGEDPFVFVPK